MTTAQSIQKNSNAIWNCHMPPSQQKYIKLQSSIKTVHNEEFAKAQLAQNVYNTTTKWVSVKDQNLTQIPQGLSYYKNLKGIDFRGNELTANDLYETFKNTGICLVVNSGESGSITYLQNDDYRNGIANTIDVNSAGKNDTLIAKYVDNGLCKHATFIRLSDAVNATLIKKQIADPSFIKKIDQDLQKHFVSNNSNNSPADA